jgi:hypothetical protein
MQVIASGFIFSFQVTLQRVYFDLYMMIDDEVRDGMAWHGMAYERRCLLCFLIIAFTEHWDKCTIICTKYTRYIKCLLPSIFEGLLLYESLIAPVLTCEIWANRDDTGNNTVVCSGQVMWLCKKWSSHTRSFSARIQAFIISES